MKKRVWAKSGLIFVLSLSLLLFASFITRADEVKYIYDDLGRLYRVIDEQGNVATYNYDAVGNLLSITRGIGAPPVVTGIHPDSASVGVSVDVTISGSHLSGTTVRTDNASIAISNTITTDTSMRTRFKISPLARLGLTTVTVSNILGSAGISFGLDTLTLSLLLPDSGPVSRLVEIYGSGFSAILTENQVGFNSVVAPVYYFTPARILTSVPAGAASGPVTVTTPGGTSNGIHFTVTSVSGPPPTIQSITPNVGTVEGGNVVTITGSGFTSDTAVYIGQNPVAALTIVNTSTLEITTSPGQAGPADVLVRNANGDAFRPGGFRYLPGPLQKIVSVSPTAGLTNVPINSSVMALFAEPVDRGSISSSAFSLRGTYSGIPVTGTFFFDLGDRLVIFRPNGNLSSYTSYTLILTRDIKSVNGVPLDRLFSASFSTSAIVDIDSPTVVVSPGDGAIDVPVNALVVFGFSEPVNLTTINSSNITITNNGMPVIGNITPSNQNKVITFTPFSAFIPNSLVRVTLSRRVTDMVGHPIVGNGGVSTDFVSAFRTAGTSDSLPPQVININPVDGATRVNPNTVISVTFNEAINSVTVNADTFIVSTGGTRTLGQISFSGQNTTATFTPDQPFAQESSVTVNLTTGISDMAGNAMSAPFSSSFAVQRGPVLTITYSGATNLTVGDTTNVQVANEGDVGTASTYTVKLSDTGGTAIYQNTISDTIPAGASKNYSFQIPFQTAAGNYLLYAEVTDNQGKKTSAFFPIRVTGLNATLTTRTDKEFYLFSESITAITSVSTGMFGIEDGQLKLTVGSLIGKQFSKFLPKENWAVFNNPRGVAVSPDGSFYVADAGNYRIQKFDSAGKIKKIWGSYGSGNGQFERITSIAAGPNGSVYVVDVYLWRVRIQKFDDNGNFITGWSLDGGTFSFPSFGIAIGPDGSVFIADQGNHRILKFDGAGNLIGWWGGYGWGDGQFIFPTGIAVGPDGAIYVANLGDQRIQKFDRNGTFLFKWGSEGQFHSPFCIAVSSDGSIYVVDKWDWRHRIQKFDSNGNLIHQWFGYGSGDDDPSNIALGSDHSIYVVDRYGNRVKRFDINGNLVTHWGNYGNGDEQFIFPMNITFKPDGTFYVADTVNHRIQKFDPQGNFVLQWGGRGGGDGNFDYPRGIAVGPDGSVFVADAGKNRIQKFDKDGNFIAKWGNYGSREGEFSFPEGIAIDPYGFVCVADTDNHRIQRFDGSGNFIMKWGTEGNGDGQFFYPESIAMGFDGSIYVSDTGNHRIQKFDHNGNFLSKWGSEGGGDGQFRSPSGITVGQDGSIFVVDPNNHRIQQFDSTGNFIARWGSQGYQDGQFMRPYGIGLGPDGSIYVADTGNHRIQKLAAETLFETTFPVNQSANTTRDYITGIGVLNATGKFHLHATLINSLGQTLAQSSYLFFHGFPLKVLTTSPVAEQNNVPINTLISVRFDRPVDRTTVNQTNFSLVEHGSGLQVSGTFSYEFGDTSILFKPAVDLKPFTTYTLSLAKTIMSMEGVPLDQPLSISFTTAGFSDAVSPMVVVSPGNGAVAIPINALIVFGFSEPINPTTVNSSTIAITNNGITVSGTLTLSQENRVATFSPAFSYLPDSTVNVTLSRSVKDMAGNPIVGSSGIGTDFISYFITASIADTSPPQVLNVNPSDGATGVDPNTHVSVTFNEPINPFTVNAGTFTVSINGIPHSGRISFSDQDTKAIFTPDQPFPLLSLVQVTLEAGIIDLAGNAIPSPFTSLFTTYQKGPELSIRYSGATTLNAGDMIDVDVTNTGDVQTTSIYTVKLRDMKGVVIYQNTITDLLQPGVTKSYGFQISTQAADGDYTLHAEVTDYKGRKTMASFSLKISGLSAILNTRTDKDVYLLTEPITGITGLSNGLFGIAGGSLKVTVSALQQEQFAHFIPKGWTRFYMPTGITMGTDGSVYVADRGNHRIQKLDRDGNLIMRWGSYGSGDREFKWPYGVAAGPDGFIYVADSGNCRIQKFNSNGMFVMVWGSEGAGDGQFDGPTGIAVGTDGSVYVVDSGNYRIQKFDSNGNFITKWGSYGYGDGRFYWPSGIAIDSEGSVYVADSGAKTIQKFDAHGNFLARREIYFWFFDYENWEWKYWMLEPYDIAIGPDGSLYATCYRYIEASDPDDPYLVTFDYYVFKFDINGDVSAYWGGQGNWNGQFEWPTGIALGIDGLAYVVDSGNHRIQKFDTSGNFVGKWGKEGTADGKLDSPYGITLSSDGSIYVADTYNHRIQKFDSNGSFITKWASQGSGNGQFYFSYPRGVVEGVDNSVYVLDSNRIQKFDRNGNFMNKWGSYGSGDGQFSIPEGIAAGRDGSIYVADSYNHRIQKFNGDGSFITKWGVYGNGEGEFNRPYGITMGLDGSVFVADSGNNRIQKFDSNGAFITKWGSEGNGEGQFRWPYGVAVGHDDSVYVADTFNGRIQKFDRDGNFITKWGRQGEEEGEFLLPSGIVVTSDGSIYVADTSNHRIQKLAPQILFETTFPVDQPANTTRDYFIDIGLLNEAGRFSLLNVLTNSLGQTIAQGNYSFGIGP